MPVLVEINVGREENKSGIMPEQAEEFMSYVKDGMMITVKEDGTVIVD